MIDNREKAPSRIIMWTKIVLILFLFGLILYDVFVATNEYRGDTISEVTLWLVLRSLTASAILGYVAGHLTWPSKKRRPVKVVMVINIILFAAVLCIDILVWSEILKFWVLDFLRQWPPITFLVFYILGRILWPQARSGDSIAYSKSLKSSK